VGNVIRNDLVREGDHFPLGENLAERESSVATPFGLRYATLPNDGSRVELDFSRISYDPERQIATVIDDDGSIIPAMRHTSTQTKTTTASQDRKGDDSDTDATGT
jgi:putative ATP-grasp target RiPP